jgi:hypothetical protein
LDDSRKEERHPVALVMRYREPTMLEAREAQCQNVSLSGMYLVTPRPSPRGALVRFECISGGSVENIRGTGRVVWQRGKSDQRGPAGMGVRFVRLEPGCAEALEALLDQLGLERRPSSAPPPREKKSSRPPPREPASDRPGQATQLIVPAVPINPLSPSPTGITQQGMGATRSRALHYPTLRGIPASSVPPAPDVLQTGLASSAVNGSSGSTEPPSARATEPDGVDARSRSSPLPPNLNKTLPGHTSITGSPFPPSKSAPPPAPVAILRSTVPPSERAGAGGLRERLDRTRRGVPPPPSTPPSDEPPSSAPPREAPHPSRTQAAQPIAASADPKRPSAEEPRPVRTVDEPRAAKTIPEAAEADRPASGKHASRPPPAVTAEPVDDATAGARRRAARAADVATATPVLPDPDAAPRRNWLPWLVVGGGLLVSGVVVQRFGSMPIGVPVRSAEVAAANAAATGSSAQPNTAAGQPASGSQPVGAAADPNTGAENATGPRYVLDVASEPPGARVSAAGQWVLTPGSLELLRPTAPIDVKAEFAGRKSQVVTVGPDEFALKDGRYVHRVVIKLPAEAEPPAAAPEAAKSQPAPSPASSTVETSTKPAPRKPAAKQVATEPEAPPTPQIAKPPVPIGEAVSPAASSLSASSGSLNVTPKATGSESQRASAGEAAAGSPLATALECLSRGDNPCVIAALQGRAKSERELGVLIETYLVVGNTSDAERYMSRYLQSYPDGKLAQKFRRRLEN